MSVNTSLHFPSPPRQEVARVFLKVVASGRSRSSGAGGNYGFYKCFYFGKESHVLKSAADLVEWSQGLLATGYLTLVIQPFEL